MDEELSQGRLENDTTNGETYRDTQQQVRFANAMVNSSSRGTSPIHQCFNVLEVWRKLPILCDACCSLCGEHQY